MRQEVDDKFGVEVHQSAAWSVERHQLRRRCTGNEEQPAVCSSLPPLIVLALLVTLAGIALSAYQASRARTATDGGTPDADRVASTR